MCAGHRTYGRLGQDAPQVAAMRMWVAINRGRELGICAVRNAYMRPELELLRLLMQVDDSLWIRDRTGTVRIGACPVPKLVHGI